MNNVQKSIGWADYTINPVKGLCPMACPYCYARRMYKRFRWPEEIRFDPTVFNDLAKMKAGSKVFWGSTMELSGDWVDPEWTRLIFEAVKRHPELTHIFLTKNPAGLIPWSPFPDNCWVGVSATDIFTFCRAMDGLAAIYAPLKFLSFEPLLADIGNPGPEFLTGIGWVICGQCTPMRASTSPRIEWVKKIVEAADRAGAKVWLKDNLWPEIPFCPPYGNRDSLYPNAGYRHEFPVKQETK